MDWSEIWERLIGEIDSWICDDEENLFSTLSHKKRA